MVNWGRNYAYFHTVEKAAFTKSGQIIIPDNFAHLDGHVETSSHHGTNCHVGKGHIIRKNHKDWSIGTDIMPIFIS